MAELDQLRGLKRGTLRLGLPPVGSSTLFAPLFATYHKRHPGVEIRLVEHGGERLEELLLSGEIELAASLLPVSDTMEWQPVRREPLAVLLSANDELSRRRSVGLPAVKQLPFILFETGFALNRIILDACHRHGFEPNIVARSSQIDFIVELVAAGLGVAFLPRMIAERRKLPSVSRVPLVEPDTDWHIAMVWRRGAYLSQAASAWLDLVSKTWGKPSGGSK
jgi:DNA-binding transcriptional LysR family regulator